MDGIGKDKEEANIICKNSCFEIKDGVPILTFDSSGENFLNDMETILVLCGQNKEDGFEASDVEHFKARITFLRDWKQFYFCEWMPFQYQSKTINFSSIVDSEEDKHAINGINLPPFSSAAVPKKQMEGLRGTESFENDDFVLHVGGSVWALDWCPRLHEDGGHNVKCEYLAVAVHPIGSDYHKIGEQLSGRGVIQIWCFLHLVDKEESPKLHSRDMRSRGRPRKSSISRPNGVERNHFDAEVSNMQFTLSGVGSSKASYLSNEFITNQVPNNSNKVGDFDCNNEANPSDDDHIERPRKRRGRPKKNTVPKICKPRGRPRKCAVSVQNNFDMEGSYAPSSSKASSLPNEYITNQVPSNSCKVGDFNCNNEVNPSDGNHIERPRKQRGRPKNDTVPKICKPRGRPRKCALLVQNNFNMEGSYAPSCSKDPDTSNDGCVLKESHGNELPRKMYSAGDVDGNIEAGHGVHHIESSRKHQGRTKNVPVANVSIPNEKSRKSPNLGSYDSAVIYDGHLLNSSSLSDSRDMANFSRHDDISFACYKEGSQNSITSVSDQSGRHGRSFSHKLVHDHPEMTTDDFNVPLASFLHYGSNGKDKSFAHGRKNSKKSPFHNEGNVAQPCKENLLVLPISIGCEAPRENVSEKVIQDKNWEVKDDAAITHNGNDQALETNHSITKEMTNGLEDRKLQLRKKMILNMDKSVVSASSPIILERGLEPIVQTSHCWELTTKKPPPSKCFIPEGIALPRLVLSLAHNGKVAWDLKWRPLDEPGSEGMHHMGYLALLLGNGSLEVWEVPLPNVVKFLYTACHAEGTDPRFLKLQPVFSCSKVKFRDRQSIPLTLEWSPSGSHDLILVGCHDGTVALWKFCPQHSSEDTKPLQCFTADAVPIRALAWAPDESDVECSNLIVTAGHGGLKFWDLRDPYRPLWDLYPVQRAILGIDWLKNPRCVIIAYEDGNMRLVSLANVANDVPVTGEILTRTKQAGLHTYMCSSFAIWSVQVSRSTGLVAYCSADGCTSYFQLTAEAVDKQAYRYRKPHFLCGSITEEGSLLKINTPSKCTPLPKLSVLSRKTVDVKKPSKSSHSDGDGFQEKGEACLSKGDELKRQRVLGFPPKSVALHKVRWNMNKGSGRWLCYGGAAGIVRCQAISSKSLV
ncbi:hypothetical protein HPP92_015079 [Vanilla planifolia]|uniref:Uncharacterized protein n=1 Tax=Vanilla planifolia TaxID=51239 RepID=A0A835QQT6_VANPL|nr:hypothetical protein HPP92_015079 [Vanilla planifolia]